MVASILVASLIAGQDFPPQTNPLNKRWFVFLNSGPNKSPLSSEESAAGMKGHLGNFSDQYKAGRLDLAGPLGSNGFIRGIVVVRAADERGVKALFATDPFVKDNRLTLEMYAMEGPFERILHPDGEIPMTTLTLVVFKKGEKWNHARRMARDIPVWEREGKLAFWAKFGLKDREQKIGMAWFWEKDTKLVAHWLQSDPYVVSRELAYEVHPQYIGDMFKKT